jgi:hypothetical protein
LKEDKLPAVPKPVDEARLLQAAEDLKVSKQNDRWG